MSRYYFTSESVTEGHPDKIADRISDALLDAFLKDDPLSRVATDKTLVTTGLVLVAGEVSAGASVDVPTIVRRVIKDIGYTRGEYGIDADSCGIIVSLDPQSADIAQGVTKNGSESVGAGDQGLMFGYATNETEQYMPPTIEYAHLLARRLATVRKKKILDYLRPDGKSQVTLQFSADGKPERCEAIVLAAQHDEDVSQEQIQEDLKREVVGAVFPNEWIDAKTNYFINHTGRFVKGGPSADSGLTGRKIIVDTYGGVIPHGGGAFSGKDPTKVDRSAAYYARYVAKNLVAAGFADKLQIQVAYSIGAVKPLSTHVETFGTGKVSNDDIEKVITAEFDFSPGNIIKELNLRHTAYEPVAAYGHFGRDDLNVPWEKLDRVDDLAKTAEAKTA